MGIASEEVPVGIAADYGHCWELTRAQAKNFSYGIRLLPPGKRRAMAAVYAFARRVDDVGDSDAPIPAKEQGLRLLNDQIDAIAAGRDIPDADPVLRALADSVRRFALPLDAFADLIRGCQQDLATTTYATMEELVVYCRLVAGSIGRLTIAVLGTTAPADHLADDLGVALQLTNILRDIVEDRDVLGRIYLPRSDAERFDCSPRLEGSGDDLLALISYEAALTEPWYERGKLLLPLLDRRSSACVGAMAGIYYGLLQRIRRDPAAVLRTRVSLSGQEKAWVAARSLVGAGW